MTRGWRQGDPAIAALIERYAPELLDLGDRALAGVFRSSEEILRDGALEELEEEILEERLVDHLLDERERRCRP